MLAARQKGQYLTLGHVNARHYYFLKLLCFPDDEHAASNILGMDTNNNKLTNHFFIHLSPRIVGRFFCLL